MVDRIQGLQFTAESFSQIDAGAVPELGSPKDLEGKAQELRVWERGKGFEYDLPGDSVVKIMSWEDYSGTLRLAVAENVDGEWPVYREPTFQEMFDFLQVAQHVMPDTPRTNVLNAQVVARLRVQAKVMDVRALQLRGLADKIQI